MYRHRFDELAEMQALRPGQVIYWTGSLNPAPLSEEFGVIPITATVTPADVAGLDIGCRIGPSLDAYSDAVSAFWHGMLASLHTPCPAGVRPSDETGIQAATVHQLLGASDEVPPPAPPSRIKPALAGLGVTASGDHRLGRFNVAGD